MQDVKDITIIGAGPTGLFGAFYAGMRGASCRIIDALPELGGQLMALYPEKFIFDVAGFSRILAKDFVKAMAEQALQFGCEGTRVLPRLTHDLRGSFPLLLDGVVEGQPRARQQGHGDDEQQPGPQAWREGRHRTLSNL